MNPMQNKLTQVYREYIEFKDYIEKNKIPLEELKKKVFEEALNSDRDEFDVHFETFGEKQLEEIDLVNLRIRLYHTYEAYKDLTEIPDEIKKEVENIDVKYHYSVKDGERKIADKNLLEQRKKEAKDYYDRLQEQMQSKELDQ